MILTSPKWGSVLRVVRLATGGCTVTWSHWLLKIPYSWILRQFHSEVLEYEMLEELDTPEWEQAFMFAVTSMSVGGVVRRAGFTREAVRRIVAMDVSLPKERLGVFELIDGTYSAVVAWGLRAVTSTTFKTANGTEIRSSWVKGGHAYRANTLESVVLKGLKMGHRARLESQLPDHIVSLHILQTEEELKK